MFNGIRLAITIPASSPSAWQLEAVTVALSARSSWSSFLIPGMVWSSFRSSCCSSAMCLCPSVRGSILRSTHMAAAVPAACPMVANVLCTRTVPSATCEKLAQRPAISRLSMFFE